MIHGEFGIHALELGVFGFELFDALQLGNAEPAVSALPVVVGRHRNAVLAANVGDFDACVAFPKDGDDLCFGESALLHDRSSGPDLGLYFTTVA